MSDARNRLLVRALVVAGTVLAVLAIFAVWIERQALNTTDWTSTSGKLLESKPIQKALSKYLVDQLFSAVDVSRELRKVLPKAVKPLAGPATGGLRKFATQAAQDSLGNADVQAAWRDANRGAHQELLAIVENRSQSVSTQGGDVTLNLRPLIVNIAGQVGVGGTVRGELPRDVGQLEVFHSDDLKLAQDIARWIKGLALALSLLTIGVFSVAIYLARGRRVVAVLGTGIGLIVAGICALAARHVLQGVVVDALVSNDSVKPAANATWSIGTSLLQGIAITAIIYGTLFVIASYLASPTPSAAGVRRVIAPTLRDRPMIVYGVYAAIVLVYLISAPTHGLRSLLTILLVGGMGAVGIDRLRRQTRREFPDAEGGDWRQRLRDGMDWIQGKGAGIGTAISSGGPDQLSAEDARIDRLERLASLKERGLLTQKEFAAEKARVLAGDSDQA